MDLLSLVGLTISVLHPDDGCSVHVTPLEEPDKDVYGEYILDSSLEIDIDDAVSRCREYGQIDAPNGGSVSPEEFDKTVATWLKAKAYKGVPFLSWSVEYDINFSFVDIKRVLAQINELLTSDCKWARKLAQYVQDNREWVEENYK